MSGGTKCNFEPFKKFNHGTFSGVFILIWIAFARVAGRALTIYTVCTYIHILPLHPAVPKGGREKKYEWPYIKRWIAGLPSISITPTYSCECCVTSVWLKLAGSWCTSYRNLNKAKLKVHPKKIDSCPWGIQRDFLRLGLKTILVRKTKRRAWKRCFETFPPVSGAEVKHLI